jgi:hypothetical protein
MTASTKPSLARFTIRDGTKPNAEPIILEADHAKVDENTQRVSFYDDAGNLVGSFVNINFFKQG